MTGYHPANFGLPRPFRSRVKLRHATNRQTDRQTDTAAHFIMPPSLRGRRNNNTGIRIDNFVTSDMTTFFTSITLTSLKWRWITLLGLVKKESKMIHTQTDEGKRERDTEVSLRDDWTHAEQ